MTDRPASFREAAASLADELHTLLPTEAAAFTSPDQAYAEDFIDRCAACADDTRTIMNVREALAKLKGFKVRDFNRLIKEAQTRSFAGAKLNGHAATSSWRQLLLRNAAGAAKPILANAITALRHAPEWQGVLAYNEFSNRIEKLKPTPFSTPTGQWTEFDLIKATEWLQTHSIEAGITTTADAIQGAAHEHSYHPVRDYLSNLKWDGEKRIHRFLCDCFGVEFSELVCLISARWLISAVARIMDPGCQVDSCLVLEGKQGIYKSNGIKALAVNRDWYSDQISPLDNKDSSQDLAGKWIFEFAELERFTNKYDQGLIKNFIPRQVDHYRASFGRVSQDWPRQTVFTATTNQLDWALDETGARRWWPVRCSFVSIDRIRAERDQVWAEAVARYQDFRQGDHSARWWFDQTDPTEIRESLTNEQEDRYAEDSWDSRVMEWILKSEKEYYEEERYRSQVDNREVVPYFIHTDSILELCIKKPLGSWTKGEKDRISNILTHNHFERFQRRMTYEDGSPVLDPNTGKQRRERYYRRKAR